MVAPVQHTPDHQVPDTIYKIPREVILAYNSKKRIGNYLIGKTIGEGAFAKVKEGMHVVTGEKVAIKIIDKTKAKQDSYLWKNLRREVKLLQCMRHPNVVGLYESLETDMAYYLVLELIRGGEMKDYISKLDKLSEEETKKYMRQLLSAVYHIHSAGVVHRDLKVENIMLNRSGDLKIIDFGLSNCVKSLESRGGKGTQCGSPAYAAPELLANKGYDNRVDIWAIGINMFAMLVGKLPFKVKPFNLKKLYQKMITGDMELMPPGTTQDARDLLTRLLQPDPNDRISIKECASHAWLAESPISFLASPNFPISEELNQEVLKYMGEFHSANVHSLILDLLTHNINSNTATYHHMCSKFDRYKSDQEKGITESETVSSATIIKKEVSVRRGSKTRVLKRRPKTAGSTVRRNSAPISPEPPCPNKPRRNSIGTVRKPAAEKKPEPAQNQQQQQQGTKEAFAGRKEEEKELTKEKQDSGFCGSRRSSSVVSCKSRVETMKIPTTPRTYSYCQNENTNRDGRANWRHTPLLRNKYLNNAARRVSSNPTVNFSSSAEGSPLTETTNTSHQEYSGTQWLRHSAKSLPNSRSPPATDNMEKTCYKWKQELYRTKLSLSRANTPVYKRNISFPQQNIYRPQFRTYTLR